MKKNGEGNKPFTLNKQVRERLDQWDKPVKATKELKNDENKEKSDEIFNFLSPFNGNDLISVTSISEGIINNTIEVIIKIPVTA
jgi:hypothetical protein